MSDPFALIPNADDQNWNQLLYTGSMPRDDVEFDLDADVRFERTQDAASYYEDL